jgi:hypothetical protein
MKTAIFVLLTTAAFAQPITIQAGSPTDQFFNGGTGAWPMPLPAPLAFLRYGTSFSYAIPLPNGLYNISVMMVEPNKTGPGQRLFNVSANGQASAPLDLYALTGGVNVAYTLPMMALVGAGFLRLQFTAAAGNAVVSEILVTQAPSVLEWTSCNTPPTIASSCFGLEFFSIIKADGTIVFRYAVPAPGVPSPPWTAVK